jgi:hypothetical protein
MDKKMHSNSNQFGSRLLMLNKFLTKLEITSAGKQKFNNLEIAGIIKWFELSFELAWKIMQDYLASAGYNDIKAPRPVIMQMGLDNIIDPFKWEEL